MSNRAIDSRGEKALGVFLDKYFYDKGFEKRVLGYCQRIFQRELQIKGIDVLFDEKKVDEKAQLHYINKPIDTFAFEIDYFDSDKNRIVDGWFVSPSNQTEEYLLMWIHKARTNKLNRIVADDFEQVEADLVAKQSLKKYLGDEGVTDAGLKKIAANMRAEGIARVKINDDCDMVYSVNKGYEEEPINLVIKKGKIEELSLKRFMISKEAIVQIE